LIFYVIILKVSIIIIENLRQIIGGKMTMLSFKQAMLPVITMIFLILMSVTYWDAPIQMALFF